MTPRPLLDRIRARREGRPYEPVPLDEHRSELSKRLAQKRLDPKEFYNGAAVPDGDRGAA